jgi:hypothetical protein
MQAANHLAGAHTRLTARRRPLRPAAEAGAGDHGPSGAGRARAFPERRSSRFSTVRSPVLRSLALSTVALPRQQLQERYGAAFADAEQLAAPRRAPGRDQQQQRQRAAAQEDPLSRDALVLVLLATAVSFICSIDRAAMSVAILPMSDQFAWDDSVKGSVSSAFFAGYMVTNLCGGFLATRYSAKGVLALGVVLWSLFTIATPAAAAGNLGELLLAR